MPEAYACKGASILCDLHHLHLSLASRLLSDRCGHFRAGGQFLECAGADEGEDGTSFVQSYGEHTLVLLRHGELAPRSLTFKSMLFLGPVSRSEWNLQNRFTG